MKVNEIFVSIDGEVNRFCQGKFSTFVRLQKCNLNCDWCDAPGARNGEGGEEMSVREVLDQIARRECPKVTITGGEPMLQWDQVNELIMELTRLRCNVTIETNGTIEIPYLALRHHRVGWVIDYKLDCPDKMVMDNFKGLPDTNWVKIVVGPGEYQKARAVITMLRDWGCNAQIALSPVDSDPDTARWLLNMLVTDKLWDVALNLQLHKIIGVR